MSLTKELFLANLRKRGDANSETYVVQEEINAKTKRGRKTKTAESKTIFKNKPNLEEEENENEANIANSRDEAQRPRAEKQSTFLENHNFFF